MEAMKKKFLNMRSFREITWKSSIDLPMLKSFFSFFDMLGTVYFITCHVPFSCKNINLRLQRTYPCWYLLCILYVWIFSDSFCLYTILRATWIMLIRTVVLLAARYRQSVAYLSYTYFHSLLLLKIVRSCLNASHGYYVSPDAESRDLPYI